MNQQLHSDSMSGDVVQFYLDKLEKSVTEKCRALLEVHDWLSVRLSEFELGINAERTVAKPHSFLAWISEQISQIQSKITSVSVIPKTTSSSSFAQTLAKDFNEIIRDLTHKKNSGITDKLAEEAKDKIGTIVEGSEIDGSAGIAAYIRDNSLQLEEIGLNERLQETETCHALRDRIDELSQNDVALKHSEKKRLADIFPSNEFEGPISEFKKNVRLEIKNLFSRGSIKGDHREDLVDIFDEIAASSIQYIVTGSGAPRAAPNRQFERLHSELGQKKPEHAWTNGHGIRHTFVEELKLALDGAAKNEIDGSAEELAKQIDFYAKYMEQLSAWLGTRQRFLPSPQREKLLRDSYLAISCKADRQKIFDEYTSGNTRIEREIANFARQKLEPQRRKLSSKDFKKIPENISAVLKEISDRKIGEISVGATHRNLVPKGLARSGS